MSNEIKTDLKLAMTSAAKMIEEKNLDINSINGTGVDGRVTKGALNFGPSGKGEVAWKISRVQVSPGSVYCAIRSSTKSSSF